MYLCLCLTIKDSAVKELGRQGITEAEELAETLHLHHPDCCGSCLENIDDFVRVACEGARERAASTGASR